MGFFQKSPASRSRPMHGYNFTERTRAVLARARDEAAALGHEYVGTEHMLLALVVGNVACEGVSAAVLANLGADPAEIRERTLAMLTPSAVAGDTGPDLPYTSRAKRALELAMTEARELHHSYVGTEHLLLGLLREEHGIGAQMLVACGVTLDAARAETGRLFGSSVVGSNARSPQPLDSAGVPRGTGSAPEAVAWQRLLHALDVTARLGGTPAVTLEADGSLTVSLGPDLVLSVALPPDARVRRRVD